jgi:hypothetical protein
MTLSLATLLPQLDKLLFAFAAVRFLTVFFDNLKYCTNGMWEGHT